MTHAPSLRRDEQVAAIMADPRAYFADARARAQVVAAAEVQVDLAARARRRQRPVRGRR